MKIKKLLEYQEVDKEFHNLNRDLNSSNEAKAVYISKNQVGEAKDALIKLDRMAGELIANFDKNLSSLKSNQDKAKEFKKVISDINDLTELEYVQKKLDELIAECNNLNKEINSQRDKIQYIKIKTNEAMKLGKDSQDKYKEAKKAFDKLKVEMYPQAQAISERLTALEDEINDPILIERFKKLRANNITPIFVKCENATCMGCGMNIASNLHSKLKTGEELPECPNCGRIMYSPDME